MQLSAYWSFIAYVVVQLLAYCIDFGTFVLLMDRLQSSSILANAVGKINACVFAFYMHRWFTFSSTGAIGAEATRYATLAVLNTAAASALLWLLLAAIPGAVVAKVISDVIFITATFAIARIFVFGQKARA